MRQEKKKKNQRTQHSVVSWILSSLTGLLSFLCLLEFSHVCLIYSIQSFKLYLAEETGKIFYSTYSENKVSNFTYLLITLLLKVIRIDNNT